MHAHQLATSLSAPMQRQQQRLYVSCDDDDQHHHYQHNEGHNTCEGAPLFLRLFRAHQLLDTLLNLRGHTQAGVGGGG